MPLDILSLLTPLAWMAAPALIAWLAYSRHTREELETYLSVAGFAAVLILLLAISA